MPISAFTSSLSEFLFMQDSSGRDGQWAMHIGLRIMAGVKAELCTLKVLHSLFISTLWAYLYIIKCLKKLFSLVSFVDILNS